jgi:hypothetical protein
MGKKSRQKRERPSDEGERVVRRIIGQYGPIIHEAHDVAVALRFDPPVVVFQIFGEARDPADWEVSVRAVDVFELAGLSPDARSDPAGAFRDLVDIAGRRRPGCAFVVAADATGWSGMFHVRLPDRGGDGPAVPRPREGP